MNPEKLEYELSLLIKSSYVSDRKGTARYRNRLAALIADPDFHVRRIVAMRGFGLDVLISDTDWSVRHAVASKGYGLDTLITDECWHVRQEVARHGYGLDILKDDPDQRVRHEAIKRLRIVAENG